MKRHVIAGLAVAGALSLWVGGTAVAADDPADTLLHTAHGYAATASDKVSGCAETQITLLEAATPPAGLDAEARDQAIEKANEKVLARTEAAQSAIWAQFEGFAETVDTADEDGSALPTAADLQKFKDTVDKIATDACKDIAAVTVEWPNPATVKPGDKDNEQGDESEKDSESKQSKSHEKSHETASTSSERD